MEELVDVESEEETDESLSDFSVHLEEEVNINIHFHCEHCVKLSKCFERTKPGWCCDVIDCNYGCGMRFHQCKTEEHNYICSHARVPCINEGYGCPHIIQRQHLAEHLPICPASVIVCNSEWNRWGIGARERERIAVLQNAIANYHVEDLDMSFAIHDQKLVNEMHLHPKYLRKLLCNGITKRFPSLPLSVRGTYREDSTGENSEKRKRHSKAFQEDASDAHVKKNDDISARCCSHGIMKDLCNFCRDTPDEPNYKMRDVWRERIDPSNPGIMAWKREQRIEKVRKRNPFGNYTYKLFDESEDEEETGDGDTFEPEDAVDQDLKQLLNFHRYRTPPPTSLTPKGLSLELTLKHYSRHQVKPSAMFTFQCMQQIRRDEFGSHYQNVHSEIQEGLDGWIMERCPLHILGCPFSHKRLCPGKQETVVFSHSSKTFGIKCTSTNFLDDGDKTSSRNSSDREVKGVSGDNSNEEELEAKFLASSQHITYLPIEVLQKIACYLDGFSLNNLSLTSTYMRSICYSLLDRKGLVIQEWVRTKTDEGKISWNIGRNRWFFSDAFKFVHNWKFVDKESMSNHLASCPFNNRCLSEKKFCYSHVSGRGPRKSVKNSNKLL